MKYMEITVSPCYCMRRYVAEGSKNTMNLTKQLSDDLHNVRPTRDDLHQTFLSLSTPLLSHIYKPSLSLAKRQMKSFTKKVFYIKKHVSKLRPQRTN